MVFATGYWHYLLPTSWSLFPDSVRSVGTYLHFQFPNPIPAQPFKPAQKLSYFVVIFLLAPLQIATGAAMSPVLTRFPRYGQQLFGGKQGASSLHFLGLGAFGAFETQGEGKHGCCYGVIPLNLATSPHTLLAPEMNGAPLPIEHGAPIGVRIEIQLGFKMVKWIKAIEFVEDYRDIGMGQGGWREDQQYYASAAGI